MAFASASLSPCSALRIGSIASESSPSAVIDESLADPEAVIELCRIHPPQLKAILHAAAVVRTG